ncbi:MAG: tetratricopeptide repeat protein [Nitrospiraceae bacterium]|nr:MAG: tetratricopeptide repeat protein [Nitrospiraceae bacterium]
MKYYLILFILVFSLTACSDDMLSDSSSYEQGIALAAAGNLNKAEAAFREALNDEADKNAAEQSLAVIRESLSQNIQSQVAVDFFKGIQYGNNGEPELAFSYFSKAIKTAPDFANAYYERGIINGRLNLYKKAVGDFTKVIELNPDDVAAFNNRGLARARGLKKYDEAIADFSKAVELDPQFAEAYDNRGIAYRMAGNDKVKACADWKKACDLNRCDSYNLARQNGYCQ